MKVGDEGQWNIQQKLYKISWEVWKKRSFSCKGQNISEHKLHYSSEVREDEWASFATFLHSEVHTSCITTVELTDLEITEKQLKAICDMRERGERGREGEGENMLRRLWCFRTYETVNSLCKLFNSNTLHTNASMWPYLKEVLDFAKPCNAKTTF